MTYYLDTKNKKAHRKLGCAMEMADWEGEQIRKVKRLIEATRDEYEFCNSCANPNKVA